MIRGEQRPRVASGTAQEPQQALDSGKTLDATRDLELESREPHGEFFVLVVLGFPRALLMIMRLV